MRLKEKRAVETWRSETGVFWGRVRNMIGSFLMYGKMIRNHVHVCPVGRVTCCSPTALKRCFRVQLHIRRLDKVRGLLTPPKSPHPSFTDSELVAFSSHARPTQTHSVGSYTAQSIIHCNPRTATTGESIFSHHLSSYFYDDTSPQ